MLSYCKLIKFVVMGTWNRLENGKINFTKIPKRQNLFWFKMSFAHIKIRFKWTQIVLNELFFFLKKQEWREYLNIFLLMKYYNYGFVNVNAKNGVVQNWYILLNVNKRWFVLQSNDAKNTCVISILYSPTEIQ